MTRQIFRKEALQRLASPEQLDQLMPVTDGRGWLALVGIGLVLAVAMVWGIWGTIASTVEGHGVLVRRGGVTVLRSPWAGVVGEVRVAIGDTVAPGQEVARLTPAHADQPGPAQVVSPCSGRLLDVAVAPGEAVDEGSPLATIESPDQPLQAVVYCSANEGHQIRPGMEVQVLPAGASEGSGRHVRGRVAAAGRLPATRAAMLRSLQSEAWAESFLRLGPVVEVVVDLASQDTLGDTFSGSPCRARITVNRQRPVRFLLPGGGG